MGLRKIQPMTKTTNSKTKMKSFKSSHMESRFDNWVLKENSDYIEIANFELKKKLDELSIPIKELETFIDWKKINPSYNFFYDFQHNKIEIQQRLRNSLLNNYSKIYIDIGDNNPIFKIDTPIFIDKWNDFVSANGHSGIFVFTNDGELFLEFTDDASFLLFSNFII